MPNPLDRATGGGNTRLFANGTYVGMVQNANYQRIFEKIAVVEAGRLRVREHVLNGVRCSLSVGYIHLIRRPLEDFGLFYPEDDETAMLDFNPVPLEFRTLKDELIIKAEGCSPSNDTFQFSREGVWGRNVSFDATWIRVRRS